MKEKDVRSKLLRQLVLWAAATMAALALPVLAQEAVTTPQGERQAVGITGTFDRAAAEKARRQPSYSPYAGRNFPTRPFFGDTHLHTAVSFDAGAFGARLGPPDAYRLARGEEITASSGQQVQLSRPLDFLVVADHSDNMGFFPELLAGSPAVLADATGRRWYNMIQSGQGADAAVEMIVAFSQGTFPEALLVTAGTPMYRST
jgi:Protein of unknown function (DUF3604)